MSTETGTGALPPGRGHGRGPWAAAGVALAAALSVGAASSPLEGQDSAEDAWLGVGLRQSVRCQARVEAGPDGTMARSGESACRRAVIAEAVVQDAPADRAGVEPGDTLVAVNGKALSRESGRDQFGALEPGRAAQLLVGRPGEGRISVRVVPETRPQEVPPGRVRTAEARAASEAPLGLSPQALGAAEERADAVRGEGVRRLRSRAAGTVVVGRSDDGRVVLRWGEGDSVVLSGREELAPRLEAIRDSVLEEARRHLRALRKQQRLGLRAVRRARAAMEERRRAAAGGEEADEGRRSLFGTESLRAAGAEFRPLRAGLADYFPGADRGLLVMEVVPGTPADALGLRPGDVVVEAGGRAVVRPADLRDALDDYPSRDSLLVKWVRKGNRLTGVLKRE